MSGAEETLDYWRNRALRAEGWTSDAEATTHDDMFVIMDTRTIVGNTPLFWMPNGNGYGSVINEIGRYPKTAAFGGKRDTDHPVPVDLAVACARPRIDIQLLNRELEIRGMPIPKWNIYGEPRRRRR